MDRLSARLRLSIHHTHAHKYKLNKNLIEFWNLFDVYVPLVVMTFWKPEKKDISQTVPLFCFYQIYLLCVSPSKNVIHLLAFLDIAEPGAFDTHLWSTLRQQQNSNRKQNNNNNNEEEEDDHKRFIFDNKTISIVTQSEKKDRKILCHRTLQLIYYGLKIAQEWN